MNNIEAMKYAIKLALRGSGRVSPNPKVGAVILVDDVVVGEGWHRKFGGNHAEIDAMENSEIENFEGSTLVVNLEPCSHHGKTPPCAEAIIEKKFAKVVIGMQDPNPEVSGKGIRMLEDAGIEVIAGVLEEECKWLNRFFIKHITTGMPYIVVKAAQTFDSKLATSSGESKWISSEESRKRVHKLRAGLDAVLVGKGTANNDDPQLTVRLSSGRDPLRVVLDTNLSLPLGLNLFKDDQRFNTILICGEQVSSSRKADTLRIAGIKVEPVRTDKNQRINLHDALQTLSKKYNVSSILVEGGSSVYSSLAEHGLIDELQLFIAPKLFGNGLNTFDDFQINNIVDAPQFKIIGLSMSGPDIHVVAVSENH